MARPPLIFELESEFKTRSAEEAGHQNLTEYYKSLLTGASQTAQSYAHAQYQAQAQTAAEQASYDISGAYANYLKQQRNIAAQGRLESGYKEEVEDVLQQQYQSAYSQAKTTQASSLMSAKKTAQDLYSDIYGELSKSATEQIKAIEKQSEIKANLANAMIERAQLSGDSTYDWFTVNEENKTVLSDWGYDQLSKYLMTNADDFTKYLQDEGLKDELQYYLTSPADVRKEFFGITETAYNPSSKESVARKLSAKTIDEQGNVISYIDTITKPTIDLNWNDFASFDFGEKGYDKFINKASDISKYAKVDLGLTDDEIKEIFNVTGDSKTTTDDVIKNVLTNITKKIRNLPSEKRDPIAEFNTLITKLDDAARLKYIKE